MECGGDFLNADWETIGRMFSSKEGLPFSMQLDDGSAFELEAASTFWHAQEANQSHSTKGVLEHLPFDYISQESGDLFAPMSQQEDDSYHINECDYVPLLRTDTTMPMGFYNVGENKCISSVPFVANEMIEADGLNAEKGGEEMGSKLVDHQPEAIAILGKRKLDIKPPEEQLKLSKEAHKISPASDASPKRRSRIAKDVEKNKRRARSKRNQEKPSANGDSTEEVTSKHEQSVNGASSCCSSDEDPNTSDQEVINEEPDSKGSNVNKALNLNGKPRASRGAATDPQSLYARKRRERINERLKILQNLVPNGTKVDISTMLEEAVHYVKFLQLQIKLLSSDDLWMYAPVVYNGMDIGLSHKISSLF